MRILVIGSGGREHALVWKLSQSSKVEKIFCAPGNGGIADLAECAAIPADDIRGLLAFAKKEHIDLTVVGPEAPLANGIVDEFQAQSLRIFGPRKNAARLEASKSFSKEVMKKYGVPTADFFICHTMQDVGRAIAKLGLPIVIKADGLAAGKGVVVCQTRQEAEAAASQMLVEKIFGDAGSVLVVEECLQGEEASILVLTNGKTCVPLASSQDHKRIFDEDKGPNTGGMGAYSPAPVVTAKLLKSVMDQVVGPVIDGLNKEGSAYQGILYAGIMVTNQGPKVLEFNVRFGDPETQAVLARLESDLVEAVLWTLDGAKPAPQLVWDKRASVCVVATSGGYPGPYEKGKVITGLDRAAQVKDVVVFHAGTKIAKDKCVTDGGRVLGVTGLGSTVKEAHDQAYEAIEKIHFDGMHYRRDIGRRALNRG